MSTNVDEFLSYFSYLLHSSLNIAASMIGIVIGCILGLCPLLVIDQEKKQIKEAFAEADLDGDGSLNADEIAMALHRFGLMMTTDEIEWLIRRVDYGEHIIFVSFVSMPVEK